MSHKASSAKKSVAPAIVYKVECLNSQHILCKALKNSNITDDDEDYENIPIHVQRKIEKLIREKYLNCHRFKNPKITFEPSDNNAQIKDDHSDSSYSMANYSEPKITTYLGSHRSGGGCSDNYSTMSNANPYPTALRCTCKRNSSNAFRFDKRDGYDTENSNNQSKACCSKHVKEAQNFNFDTTNLYAFQRRHDQVQTDSVYTKDFCQNTHRSRESVARSKTRDVCCGTIVARVCIGIQTNENDLKRNRFADCDKQGAISNTSQYEKNNKSIDASQQQIENSGKDNCDEISEKIEFIKDNEKDLRRFSYSSVIKRNSNTGGVKKRLSILEAADQNQTENLSRRSSYKTQAGGADGRHLIDENDYYMGILNNSVSEVNFKPSSVVANSSSFGEDTYFIRLKRRGSEYINKLGSENSSEIFELQIPTTKSNKFSALDKTASQSSRKKLRISGGNQITSNHLLQAQTHYTSSSISTKSEQNIRRRRHTKKSNRLTKPKEALLYEYNYRRKYTSTDSCT